MANITEDKTLKLLKEIDLDEIKKYARKRFGELLMDETGGIPTIKNFLPCRDNGLVTIEEVDIACNKQQKILDKTIDDVYYIILGRIISEL